MSLYQTLLRQYADALLTHQFESEDPSLNGGMFCDSCKTIHGRCIDAIYGLSIAYKVFHDERYLEGAKKLLRYSSNLICADGGIYNDLQTTWRFTTVFFVIDLVETLLHAKDVLPASFVKELENHLKNHANWLYLNLDEHSKTNINYPINNALAMYLAGSYLHKENYLERGRSLADYAMKHVSVSYLLMGEGKPHDKVTKRGCNAIDIGYNMEESLPALVKYAYYSKNEAMLQKLLKVCQAHLDFILPDGAIDNSFGCRNYKWTYYGSRTCDGIIPMCLILGKYDDRFLEAAYRNLKILAKCSPKGMLEGGPDYFEHGEKACTHHTFEHMNAIAFAFSDFEEKDLFSKNEKIPSDSTYFKYYPEMDAYRFGEKKYLFDISCYDENISYSGHASGATITMLYSRKNGPVIMGSVGDYQLTELTNMQVPLDTEKHRPLLPRFEIVKDGKLYSSAYFTETKKLDEKKLLFESGLMTREGEKLLGSDFVYEYIRQEKSLVIRISHFGLDLPFLLPLIQGAVKIHKGKLLKEEGIFFLTPGFKAKEYQVAANEGEIEIEILDL